MHITIITAAMNAGGAQRVISQLLKEWITSGIRCSMILTEHIEDFYPVPAEVEVIRLKQQRHKSPLSSKLDLCRQIRSITKQLNPDIVLSMPEEVGVYAVLSLIGTKIPIVVSERNDPWKMPNKRITRFLRKIIYPFASGFIFQNERASSFFSKKIRKKGIILDNPLDSSRIPEPYSGARRNVITSVGRLEKQKNYQLLLLAFSLFLKVYDDYKLEIYGDGSMRDFLMHYASAILPKDSFEFMGIRDDVIERINSSALFVMTSFYEGVPNALIEALACGMPCVSTNFSPNGPADILTTETDFLKIVPSNDLYSLVDAMKESCNLINKTDYKLAESIKHKYSSVVVSREWANYLISIANRRRKILDN